MSTPQTAAAIYRKIRKLTQYRNKTDQEVMTIAEEMAGREQSDGYTVVNRFKNKVERALAKQMLALYLKDYIIETVADKNTLKDLVYLEVIQIRLQDKINEYHEKESQAIPLQLVEAVHENGAALQKLKDGLRANNPESIDDYSALKLLRKRHEKWMQENQLSREFRCPHCQQMVLMKLRVDRYESQKHPFFADKRLYSKHLFDNLNKEVLISREFIAQVLETSPDYIDWMLEKIREKNPQDKAVQQFEQKGTIESDGKTEEQTKERKEESTEEQIITSDQSSESNQTIDRSPSF